MRSPATLDRAASLRLALRGPCVPGSLLGRLAFYRSSQTTLPGVGLCAGRLPVERRLRSRASRRRRSRTLRLHSRRRARLGTHLERPSGFTFDEQLAPARRRVPLTEVTGPGARGRRSARADLDGHTHGKHRRSSSPSARSRCRSAWQSFCTRSRPAAVGSRFRPA